MDRSSHDVSNDEVAAVDRFVVPLPGEALMSRRQSEQRSVP